MHARICILRINTGKLAASREAIVLSLTFGSSSVTAAERGAKAAVFSPKLGAVVHLRCNWPVFVACGRYGTDFITLQQYQGN